ncbi:DNA polymerase processivity factor [White-tailed deer poxvirus]|nr:DNA polymerase processivity factor [White-tailed deer poxvirus]
MASIDDLSNLKELIKLKDCIHISDQKTRDRYNSLIDWATAKYWKIGLNKTVTNQTSISSYYNIKQKCFTLEKGNYIFLPTCFGNAYIYCKGNMMELGSGETKDIDPMCKEIIDKILTNNKNVEFLRFTYFKNKWMLEDSFSKYSSPIDILQIAFSEGIKTVPYLCININEDKIFTEDDYNSIEIYFMNVMKSNGFYINSLCFLREGYFERNIVDFFKVTYVYIKSIDLEYLEDNMYLPKLISKTGSKILVRDINHLIVSRAKINSFVNVKRKNGFMILGEKSPCNSETEAETLYRILKTIGNDFFVNGKYISKINNNLSLIQLSDKLGCGLCNTLDDIVIQIRKSKSLIKKIKSESSFEIIRECLGYPKTDFLTLVNNMNFDIKNSRVISFKLENINCLNNPNSSAIYGNFNKFIYLFNILIDVKELL